MALSTIHLFNWFYLFSLNKLSLICFCNWKKKKKTCLKNTDKANPTRFTYLEIIRFDLQPAIPTRFTCLEIICFDLRPVKPIDSTCPFYHVQAECLSKILSSNPFHTRAFPFSLFLFTRVFSVSLLLLLPCYHPRQSPTPLALSPQPSCPCLEPPNPSLTLRFSDFLSSFILSIVLWALVVPVYGFCFFGVGLLRFDRCGFVVFVVFIWYSSVW